MIEFETERLHLRQWHTADREPFARLNADSRVMAFFPTTFDRNASDALADRIEALIAERGWVYGRSRRCKVRNSSASSVCIFHRPRCRFHLVSRSAGGLRLNSWGQGYATEAAGGALHAGFDLLHLPEIVSFTALGNLRSQAVMRKLGMREAAATFEHPLLPVDSPLREHLLYRLPRTAWDAMPIAATGLDESC